MRHLSAEREADDADSVGGDSRVSGQELQRSERIGHPGRQRRAGARADDRGLVQAPRAETVVGQRREPAPPQLRRLPALVGLPEAGDRVDHHHRRIAIPRPVGKAERRGDRHARRCLAHEDLTEVGIGARAKRHQLDRVGTADLTMHERRPGRDHGGHHHQRPDAVVGVVRPRRQQPVCVRSARGASRRLRRRPRESARRCRSTVSGPRGRRRRLPERPS